MLKQSLFCTVLLFHSITHALIVESSSLNSVKKYVDADSLIIFDIDNTLIEPTTDVGSDQWFYAAINWATEHGVSKQVSLELLLPYFFSLHETLQFKPVDKRTPALINRLHKHGYRVVGLTARSPQLLEHTMRQLQETNIDLTNSWKDYAFQRYNGVHHEAYFKHGVILCGRNPKGEILKAFLSHNKLTPSKIIFVDDKDYNLKAVGLVAAQLGIPFVGIRYSYLDSKINTFTLKPATIPLALHKACNTKK